MARNELPLRPPLAAASAGATSGDRQGGASAGAAARSSAARHQGFSVAEEAESASPQADSLGVSAATGAARRNDARRTSGDARRDTRAVPADRDDADDTTRVRRTVGLP